MSIRLYFEPEYNIEWNEWSKLTGFVEGKGTWATSALLWFKNNGYEVRHISLFDYADFASTGGDYLVREFGNEVGEWQIAHSDISKEKALVVQGIAQSLFTLQEPTIDDVKQFLNDGFLVKCLVNMATLNSKEGYIGHAIVVVGYDETGFVIHDPGLPPQPNRFVTYEDFEKVWASPNKQAKELDAIKLA
jgi:hypothetical protein